MSKYILNTYLQNLDSTFIESDPISIPHRFSLLQDIEIAGFFSAIFAWGRRDIIISKASELMEIMENRPFEFVQSYSKKEKLRIQNFKHRTFNADDLDFYLRALRLHYRESDTLESLFIHDSQDLTIENALSHFYQYFQRIQPNQTRNFKHISTPEKNSACKRLCMYLRWMVRSDEIDFGIWKSIKPGQLIIPLDVHVMNIAKQFNLLEESDKANWKTALKLTEKLKEFDKNDPVKYDLALFSLGVNKEKL